MDDLMYCLTILVLCLLLGIALAAATRGNSDRVQFETECFNKNGVVIYSAHKKRKCAKK